jgi:hypothetical protein
VIGDVHQPLHCGYGYDRGGNEVKGFVSNKNLLSFVCLFLTKKNNKQLLSLAKKPSCMLCGTLE